MQPARESISSEQFGPYEVYERLGLGGMATVYRAKKRGPAGFERTVALKRMLSHLAEDASFVESFVREAKVASMLVHPNIAQVYDFGRISGIYYIAMELVSGFDVRKLLRYANRANEAIPLPVIFSILSEMCDALDYAHSFVDENGTSLNIIHRDISPSNLIVAHTGHLKVIDFGIAKANSRQLHTESGMVKGKLGYMSPEIALGMQFGSVSDIFSVGVVAWELVTASPLFSARTDFETMRKIREAEIPRPMQYNPACPAMLEQLILAALERDPDRRIPSARQMRNALDDIAAQHGIQVAARSAADWMRRFSQPEDTWARASESGGRASVSAGRQFPLPAQPLTPMGRSKSPTNAPVPLRRSSDDIQLATEIWGEDGETRAAPAPDFSVAAPALAGLPVRVSGTLPTQIAPPSLQPEPPPPRRSRVPYAILAILAILAGVLGAMVFIKKTAKPAQQATRSPPTTVAMPTAHAAVRFEIEPPGTIVDVGGKEIGRSPLDAELAPGVYSVTAHLEGFKPWTASITLRDGDRQTVSIGLEREVVAVAEPPQTVPDNAEPDKTEPKSHTGNTHRPRPRKGDKHVEETVEPPKVEPPKVEPPKVEPPKMEPPKVEPPKVEPPKVEKPARTPVVSKDAVTKLSGEVPALRTKSGESNSDVLVKMCIDEQGKVTSVKVMKSTAEVAAELERALMSWRYKPYTNKDNKLSPVCFGLPLRLVIKGT